MSTGLLKITNWCRRLSHVVIVGQIKKIKKIADNSFLSRTRKKERYIEINIYNVWVCIKITYTDVRVEVIQQRYVDIMLLVNSTIPLLHISLLSSRFKYMYSENFVPKILIFQHSLLIMIGTWYIILFFLRLTVHVNGLIWLD